MKKNSKKLNPFFRDDIKSGDIKKDDYASLLETILKADSEIMEQNHTADSTKQSVAKDLPTDASSPGANKSGNAAAKPVLSLDTMMEDQDTTVNQKPSKASGHSKQKKASDNADMKAKPQKENERTFPNGGREAPSKKSLSPRGRPKKSSTVAEKNDNTSKNVVPSKEKDMLTNSEEKNHQESSAKSNHSSKKLGRSRKDAAEGSGNKGSSSKLEMSSSEKEKNGMDEMEKKVLRRKRDQMKEEKPGGIIVEDSFNPRAAFGVLRRFLSENKVEAMKWSYF